MNDAAVEVPLQGANENWTTTWGVAPGYDEVAPLGLRSKTTQANQRLLRASPTRPQSLRLRWPGTLEKADTLQHDQHSWISRLLSDPQLRLAKRIMVAIIGGTVVLIGLALIVLPGPAFIVIPLGLAILATEFVWAKRWLRKARGMIARFGSKPPDAP